MELETTSETTTTKKTKPSGTPPVKPECDEKEEECEMPEPPSGMQGGGPGGNGFTGGVVTTDGMESGVWHPVAYLAIGAGSVVLSMVIMYSCFSNFYHKKPAETFDKWQRFLLYCVASLVLATGICAICYFLPGWLGQ